MMIRFTNDWPTLLDKFPGGGITLIHASWMNVGEPLIDGIYIVVLGFGVGVRFGE